MESRASFVLLERLGFILLFSHTVLLMAVAFTTMAETMIGGLAERFS